MDSDYFKRFKLGLRKKTTTDDPSARSRGIILGVFVEVF